MAKVLLTGFEPFAGSSLNPSQLIVESLAETQDLITAILPVEYDAATIALAQLHEQHQDATAIICLGQAEGRSALSFERVAVNLDDAALADNGGETRIDRGIDSNGAAAIFTTLPVKQMVAAVREEGVAAELSMSAGNFVCNHIFYRLQQRTSNTNIASGFIHVPLVHEQAGEFPGKPTMSLDDLVRGIKAAISVVC